MMSNPISTRARGELLRKPDVMRFFLARVISVVGDKVYYIALTAYTYSRYQSALSVSTMLLCRTAPGLILAPISGVLGDRANRKTLMITSDLVRAIILILLPFSSFMWQMYLGVFIISAFETLFTPSSNAMFPGLVGKDSLKDANSLFSIGTQLAGLIGPSIGGMLLGTLHYQWAFILDAVSFLLSALLILSLSVSGSGDHRPRDRFWRDAASGIRTVLSLPQYRLIALSNVVMMLGAGFLNALLYVFASKELGASDVEYGLMNSCIAAGAVLGAMAGVRLKVKSSRHLIPVMMCGLALTGFGAAFMGASRSIVASMALLGVIGAGNSIYNIFAVTVIQTSLPGDILAKAMGFLSAVTTTASLVMLAVAGALGDLLRTSTLLIVAGAISVIYSLWVIRRPLAVDGTAL